MKDTQDVFDHLKSIADEIEQAKQSAPPGVDAHHLKLDFPKRPASMNGVKHGLTGQNLLFTAQEFIDYTRIALGFMLDLQPIGTYEIQLAQRLIDTNWRLNRIAAIDNNLFNEALEHRAEDLAPGEESPKSRSHAQVYRDDVKTFDHLGRYETRLHRAMPQVRDQLFKIQDNRLRRYGAKVYDAAESAGVKFYEKLAELANRLEKARNELEALAANIREERASKPNLVCKKWPRLDPELEESLQLAEDQGMLPPEELADFAEYQRAA